MWFPTKPKLEAALKDLLARIGEVILLTEKMIEEDGLVESVLGPSEELTTFFSRSEKVAEGLLNLLTGLRIGGASVAEVNVRLPTAKAMVRQQEEVIIALQTARKAGVAAADSFFESKNASY